MAATIELGAAPALHRGAASISVSQRTVALSRGCSTATCKVSSQPRLVEATYHEKRTGLNENVAHIADALALP
jgi:hypothetical protein